MILIKTAYKYESSYLMKGVTLYHYVRLLVALLAHKRLKKQIIFVILKMTTKKGIQQPLFVS